jgi:hypothetical protein
MIRFAIVLIIFTGASFADTLTLDTQPLETSGTGPFPIEFQLDQGDGAVVNSVLLSNFTFVGGGSIDEAPSSTMGGVSVSTGPFSVMLTNSSFLNDIQFAFTPGNSLSFDVTATSNAEPTTPDAFKFAIFDGSTNEIPTTNPNDSFLEIDSPANNSGANTILSGSSGYSVDIAAPTFQPAGTSPVPEPSTLPLIGIAGAILARLSLKRQKHS